MANNNGLISSRDVAATGNVNSNFFIRKGEDFDVDNLTVNDDLTVGNNVTFQSVPTYTITGLQTGQRGTQTTRPLFVDTSTGLIVRPSQPLFRFFTVVTPSPTGSPTLITDANGTPYNADNWTCMVAGFFNGGFGPGAADRTYQCLCYFDVNRNWYVQYDNAGSPCSVNILAIHNALFVDGSN